MDNQDAQKLIDFLMTKIIGKAGPTINAETPLVSSGLVDSFHLVDILMELERVTNRSIPAGRVSPDMLDTVNRMLETANRIGKPRGPVR